jgi:hypothetical protein
MAESTMFEDFVTENELISRFGLKSSILNRARKKQALPCYQISQQGPRLYLKSEVADFFISCRNELDSKKTTKRRIRRKAQIE